MFEKGEYIIYGRSGICKIEDITHLSISGIDQRSEERRVGKEC